MLQKYNKQQKLQGHRLCTENTNYSTSGHRGLQEAYRIKMFGVINCMLKPKSCERGADFRGLLSESGASSLRGGSGRDLTLSHCASLEGCYVAAGGWGGVRGVL